MKGERGKERKRRRGTEKGGKGGEENGERNEGEGGSSHLLGSNQIFIGNTFLLGI